MASRSFLFLGLLFAVILVISSDVALARIEPGLAETKGAQLDGWHHHHHHHHHRCHYPHCHEEGGHEKGDDGSDHHEEAESETTKSSDIDGDGDGDGHHKHKCKHWPHC